MLMANNIVRKLCDDIQGLRPNLLSLLMAQPIIRVKNRIPFQSDMLMRTLNRTRISWVSFIMASTDGRALASMILDVLLRCNLSVANLRGQTYDGSSNMVGRVNGAQALIAAKQPLAIFVHCLMHCGNLVVADSLEASTIVRDAVGIANDVGVLFQHSTELHNLLENVNTEHASSGSHIQAVWPLCPIRVLCRGKCIRAPLCCLLCSSTLIRAKVNLAPKQMASLHP